MPLLKKLPAYVFRGTTVNYPGNKNAIVLPYTCTSSHPVKALWFALECFHKDPDNAVVYVAKTEKLSGIGIIYNQFRSIEDEISFSISPAGFYPYCEGYIHIAELQKMLHDSNIEAYNVVRKDNLTLLCKETPTIETKKVITLVQIMLPLLKK